MSAVTLLTAALQDDSGAGDAVDVSALSTLRLDWSTLADMGRLRHGYLRLFVETRSHASVPWRVVYERQLDANSWDTKPRVVLSGFDTYVRARWEGRFPRINNEQALNGLAATKFFTIGLAGDGQPDAA